jgi:hypothetical protein
MKQNLVGSTYGRCCICNLASVPDTNVACLHENTKKSCYSCWEDPDLKWKEDFPDAKLLTSVKKN